MRDRKIWRNRILGAATVGVAALTVSLATSGVAMAITVPPYPTVGVYPQWFTANNSASNVVRAAGSDTTFPMMQVLADEYNQSGLFGCALVAPAEAFCNPTGNGAQTDVADNFDSTEVQMGLNFIGSGNGQNQLCDLAQSPQPVDFSRSSKPIASGECAGLIEAGYAKDSVPATDVQSINPESFGVATGYNGFSGLSGYTSGPFHSGAPDQGEIGAVAAGWLPAPFGHVSGASNTGTPIGASGVDDPFNCKPQGSGGAGPWCSGTPFNDVDNTPSTVGGNGDTSVAYRLWCATDATRITDWGQLTNLSAANNGGTAKTVGNGAPIGVPIRIIGVNNGSGTTATFQTFAYSKASSPPTTACSGSGHFETNAASGPNPLVNDGPAPGGVTNLEIVNENNASEIGLVAQANWGGPSGTADPADQAVDIATSLYFQSLGYYNTIPNSGTIKLLATTAVTPSAWVVAPLDENETTGPSNGANIANERLNKYPTSRTLFNIWNNQTVTGGNGNAIRASAAGFINWICDTNPVAGSPGGMITKGTDNLYGPNYDTDISQTIAQFGFSRLDDASEPVTGDLEVGQQTPADNVNAPNGTCAANLPVIATGNNVLTLNTSGAYLDGELPAAIQPGWSVVWPANNGASPAVAAGSSTVVSTDTTAGVNTITLTSGAVVPAGVTKIYFPGHPPVMEVVNPNS